MVWGGDSRAYDIQGWQVDEPLRKEEGKDSCCSIPDDHWLVLRCLELQEPPMNLVANR